MKANKILLNGETLIDLTQDTVAADKLMKGATAHNKAGELIVGTYEVVIPEIKLQEKETSENGEIVPDSGYDGLSKVTVNVPVPEGYLVPTGIKEIIENGEYNIAEYEGVNINVPAPVLTYYDGSVTISGGVELISFTIDRVLGDVIYEAEVGMTWAEWCDSEYNTPHYFVYNNIVYVSYSVDGVTPHDYIENVVSTDTIIDNNNYSITRNTHGGGSND